ncbi:gamma-glutamyl-gamma-aminobutyrate hydrolase family protein [Paenarthrobacter sp. DKR-5]|uniref:gamma-glutamyl-gamma-aminobutyrate hydrolase family protein n=1 Tax=Paenarthrobacter sp. DKR-5 TaxID=2835535 RepID=UPI001BDD60B7|nr:gamma-glutamyl-gamma-aminobutyrate hydrolase family protein [Paenarthrobacter sp. DKR-5]MBT1001500.1 gamma-glutamyl-gamma-aminobutyrate hydrolase family protein [Paenarthrobacter sp. DKR-5]
MSDSRAAPCHTPAFEAELRELAAGALRGLADAGAESEVLDASAQTGPADPAAFDGVLLLGGGDVDPALYAGDTDEPALDGVHRPADEFEIRLIEDAAAAGTPVLAICRGLQLANVAFGGSLIEDLGKDSFHRIHVDAAPMAVHDVDIVPGSRLAAALGATRVPVASGHHQAVRRLGRGLRVVATADDGVIEAVEHETAWLLGVQFHPEDVAAPPGQLQALLAAFLRACRDS